MCERGQLCGMAGAGVGLVKVPLDKIKTDDELQTRAQLILTLAHEYAAEMETGRIFPPIEVVAEEGQFWLWDGFHRKQAAELCGFDEIEANVTEGDFEHAKFLALSANKAHGYRRDENDKRRVARLALLHPKFSPGPSDPHPSFSDIKKHTGVGDKLVGEEWWKMKPKVSKNTESSVKPNFHKSVKPNPPAASNIAPPLQQQMIDLGLLDKRNGEISQINKLEPEQQAAVLNEMEAGQAKTVNAAKKKIKKEKQIELVTTTAIPKGKYHIIVIDPPWQYDNRANDETHRAANPYPDMSLSEIKDYPTSELSHGDCILWLWTTNAFMKQAHEIAEYWGFEVKTILTWVKDRMGTGDWLRGQTEHCLMCVKGKPVVDLTNQTTVLHGPMREHSRKPDEFYSLVDTLCVGKRIDIFAREQRAGWDVSGAELEKF